MPTDNVARVAIAALADAGVRRCYTVPGESFLELIDAVHCESRMRLISTRHESGAAFMAEAEGKFTDHPALAMATRGPGSANLSIGVQTAFEDSTPMIVLLGDVETDRVYRGAFQEVDLPAFYKPIAKATMRAPNAQALPDLVRYAVREATTGRPGPVMIAVPADILAADVPQSEAQPGPPAGTTPPSSSGRAVTDCAELLAAAQRPIVIAGAGARHARDELVAFAERADVGVLTAFRRQDVFPNDHHNYVGHLGLATPAETVAEFRRADLVLVLGARLDEITTLGFTTPTADQVVIHVSSEPAVLALSGSARRRILSDVGEFLRGLGGSLRQPGATSRWQAAHASYLSTATAGPNRSDAGVDPAHVIAELQRVLSPDTVVASDAGNFSGFVHRYWSYRHPRTQLAPISGAMGYAVPAAIAAKIADPDREVIAIAGDGGFMMTGFEIETAVREGCAITVVVMRNGLYGTIAMHQARKGLPLAGTNIGSVDVARVAEGLGAHAACVTAVSDIEAALNDLPRDGVRLLDIVTDPDLISPTTRLSEITQSTRSQNV